MDTVVELGANQPPDRFYRGGDQIRTFRAAPSAEGDRVPEDWVGSTVTLFGDAPLGLSALPSGQLVRDSMEADPAFWLGDEHVQRFGVDPKILVKLLDAGERLPVHAHPHRSFAQEHLGRTHGKAEAWFALRPGTMYLGLQRDISRSDFAELIHDQRVEEMLALLNAIEVKTGDSVYVPPGTLHAIGADNFVVEVQEPEDMSILTEWRDFAIDGSVDGHLGLGFDTCLPAIDLKARDARTLVASEEGQSVLVKAANEYFRLGHIHTHFGVSLPATFGVLIGLQGTATLGTEAGEQTIEQGRTYLIAHAAGALQFSGDATVVLVRPPKG